MFTITTTNDNSIPKQSNLSYIHDGPWEKEGGVLILLTNSMYGMCGKLYMV